MKIERNKQGEITYPNYYDLKAGHNLQEKAHGWKRYIYGDFDLIVSPKGEVMRIKDHKGHIFSTDIEGER